MVVISSAVSNGVPTGARPGRDPPKRRQPNWSTGPRVHHPSRKAAEVLRSRDLFGAERRPELRMAAPWAGQSSGIARSRARAARRPCGEVVGHRPQAANYLDSREQEKVMSRFVFSIVPLNRGKEAICTRATSVGFCV